MYNYNQRNNQDRNYVKPNVTCHNCGKYGHYARDCKSQLKQLGVRVNVCFACNQLRHMVKDCPNRIQPQPLNNNSSNNNIRGTSTRRVNNLRFQSLNY